MDVIIIIILKRAKLEGYGNRLSGETTLLASFCCNKTHPYTHSTSAAAVLPTPLLAIFPATNTDYPLFNLYSFPPVYIITSSHPHKKNFSKAFLNQRDGYKYNPHHLLLGVPNSQSLLIIDNQKKQQPAGRYYTKHPPPQRKRE